MRISDKSAELQLRDQIQPRPAGNEGGGREATQPILPAKRADQVQISDAGRKLAAQAGPNAAEPQPAALSAERTAEIRQRIVGGAYNTLPMVEQVARRILGSGDL